jgi:hypothetical protein
MFGSGKIRVIICLWVLATAVLAVPPGSAPGLVSGDPIVAAQADAGSGSVAAAESRSSGPGRRLSGLRGWLPHLKAGLVALLLLGQAPMVDTQPGLGPDSFGVPPAVNSPAPDPVSLMVAQGLGIAMGRTNGLPPLPEINTLMAQYRPVGAAIMATLPDSAVTAESDPPPSSDSFGYTRPIGGVPDEIRPQLPSFLLNYPPNQAFAYTPQTDLATKLVAAQTDLNVARLTTAFYILESLGYEFIGLGTPLVLVNETLGVALETVGFQLAASGFFTASKASSLNAEAAQTLVEDLEKQQAQAKATAQASAKAQAHALINPNVLYGSWQRELDRPSSETIIYQFAPTEFVKFNSTLDADGLESTEIDRYPGAIATRISYRHPPGNASAADAVGRISVQMEVPMNCDPPLVLKFYYLRAKGEEIGRAEEQEFDVLVEQGDPGSLFVKVSK